MDCAQGSSDQQAVEVMFTVAFTTEMLLRMFATGLYRARHSYLRDRWHYLDL